MSDLYETTKDQERWHLFWNGHVKIVRSPLEALAAVGLIEIEAI